METTQHRVYKPRIEKVSFDNLDIKRVEEMVGRPASRADVMGNWVVLDFGNCTVSFRKW